MWRLVMALLVLLGAAACGQAGFSGTVESFEMDSTEVGDRFVVSVYLPTRYHPGTAGGFRTAYVLDGSAYGQAVAAFAEARGMDLIVVGIAYPSGWDDQRRTRDFTPTVHSSYTVETGGADAFFSFVRRELFPRMEADYAASPQNRILLGHSFGGLAGAYLALFQADGDPMFTSIGAASPSLFWDGGAVLGLEEQVAARTSDLPLHLVVSVGDLEPALLTGHARAFAQRLRGRNYPSLQLVEKTYRDTDHRTSWRPAFTDALGVFDDR